MYKAIFWEIIRETVSFDFVSVTPCVARTSAQRGSEAFLLWEHLSVVLWLASSGGSWGTMGTKRPVAEYLGLP